MIDNVDFASKVKCLALKSNMGILKDASVQTRL